MLKYIEVTGKNEDDAIRKGLVQLGMDRDDVSVEVLERAKTGFLGIGSTPAKIKISYEVPDEPAPVAEEPKAAPAVTEAPKAPAAPAPKAEEPKAAPAPKTQTAAPAAGEEEDEVAQAIRAFLTGLLAHMGAQAAPSITRTAEAYEVVLEGENLGSLIGRRGETLDAIQQLTSYSVNRGRAHRVRVHVDAEHYRARRQESLERLGRKVAGKVVKYRRNVTLEPMNAYERHIIHAALQDYAGVTTFSTGVEPNRRIVVAYAPDQR